MNKIRPKLSRGPDLRSYFGYCLHKAGAAYRAQINSALARHDIVGPQLGIMCLLDEIGSMSQVEIGKILSIDKTTIVKLLDGLEKKKWVVRKSLPNDRRVKTISLTSRASKELAALHKIRSQVEKSFLSVLSSKEQSRIREIIPKLVPGDGLAVRFSAI